MQQSFNSFELKNYLLEFMEPSNLWAFCTDSSSPRYTAILNFFDGNQFEEYAFKVIEILTKITLEDILTINSQNETQIVKEYNQILRFLDSQGLIGTENKPICFWSGQVAEKRAHSDKALSNHRIPVISFIIQTTIFLDKKNIVKIASVPFAALFASLAFGEVKFFISSDKEKEEAAITIGNYFWNYELPVLQTLYQRGIVKKILVYRYQKGIWDSDPVDLNGADALVLNVVRRSSSKFPKEDLDETCFPSFYTTEDPNYLKKEARPFIKLSKLKVCIEKLKRPQFKTNNQNM